MFQWEFAKAKYRAILSRPEQHDSLCLCSPALALDMCRSLFAIDLARHAADVLATERAAKENPSQYNPLNMTPSRKTECDTIGMPAQWTVPIARDSLRLAWDLYKIHQT